MFRIAEASQIAAARRELAEFAHVAGLSEVEAGNAAIGLTEAATNMLKHAGGGEMVLRLLGGSFPGVEILALDEGPGMADLEMSARDGYSTSATPGNGLGAMRRLATEFDAYTRPGKGSVFRMAFRRNGGTVPAAFEVGVVCLPMRGEIACGDAWTAREAEDGALFMVADGLGHGPDAAAASRAAVGAVQGTRNLLPVPLMEDIHGALRATRGAAVAVARIERGAAQIRFAGIGNISAILEGEQRRQFASHAGIVGHNMRKVSEFVQPWTAGMVLILHSDGMATHWDLGKYPGLAARHCGVIAAVLYRDLTRGRDDVTVLVIRETRT